MEKSWEHRAKLFVIFVDLKKAYNSVPRSALWVALRKLGVPDQTIQLVKSGHASKDLPGRELARGD